MTNSNLGRHDRQVGGLLALEDSTRIDAVLTKGFVDVGPTAHQAASLDILALRK
jgi:hypothetical protein